MNAITLSDGELDVFSLFSVLRSSSCFDYSNNQHNQRHSLYVFTYLQNMINYYYTTFL